MSKQPNSDSTLQLGASCLSRCSDSDSEASSNSKSPPGSLKEPSFISDSDTDMANVSARDQLSGMLCSMKLLQDKSVGEWNDTTAHEVYKAFHVKRYKVDEERLFCPVRDRIHLIHGHDCGSEVTTITDILNLCDERARAQEQGQGSVIWHSWSEFEPKIENILRVLKGEGHKLANSFTNAEDFFSARRILKLNMESFASCNSSDTTSHLRNEEFMFHKSLEKLIENMEESLKKNKHLRECFYESYFQYLVEMFARISGVEVRLSKASIFQSYEISLSSFGKVPQPDFFLNPSNAFTILAVVEVKSGKKLTFASHKGHRPKSYKDRQKLNPTDEVCPRKEKLVAGDQDVDEDEERLEKLNDKYDVEETQLEESRNESLPNHIKPLDVTEKKQIRCYMPQLLGQMLACTSITKECISCLQHPYMTQVMGIGVVGFQVQFVMLVLKDSSEKILSPTVTDLETSKSVRPYLYVTRRFNLFNVKHLQIFFRTLFALGSIQRL